MWKALSVVAALLTAGAAFFSYLNKRDVVQERDLLAQSNVNLSDINARNKEVLDKQKVMIRRNTAMEGRRDVALGEQEAEKGKLEAKTQEVMDTNTRIKELGTEIDAAKTQIAEFGNIGELVALTDQLRSDLITAKNETATLEAALATTKTREEATAGRITTFKDLEFRQRNGQMVSINANIASVYNTWGFAVLDAGDRQGVVSRTKLDVKRGGEKIAELVVTNLERNRSVCDIVPGSMQPGQMIRPGDSVSVSQESLPKPKAERDAAAAAAPGGGGAAAIPAAGEPAMEALDPAPDAGAAPAGDPADPFGGIDTPDTAPDPAPTADADDPFGDL